MYFFINLVQSTIKEQNTFFVGTVLYLICDNINSKTDNYKTLQNAEGPKDCFYKRDSWLEPLDAEKGGWVCVD